MSERVREGEREREEVNLYLKRSDRQESCGIFRPHTQDSKPFSHKDFTEHNRTAHFVMGRTAVNHRIVTWVDRKYGTEQTGRERVREELKLKMEGKQMGE